MWKWNTQRYSGHNQRQDGAVELVSGHKLLQYRLIFAAWFFANAAFWAWWLNADRIANLALFIPFSVSYGYTVTALPAMYLFYVRRMKQPLPAPAVSGRQVAMI